MSIFQQHSSLLFLLVSSIIFVFIVRWDLIIYHLIACYDAVSHHERWQLLWYVNIVAILDWARLACTHIQVNSGAVVFLFLYIFDMQKKRWMQSKWRKRHMWGREEKGEEEAQTQSLDWWADSGENRWPERCGHGNKNNTKTTNKWLISTITFTFLNQFQSMSHFILKCLWSMQSRVQARSKGQCGIYVWTVCLCKSQAVCWLLWSENHNFLS